MSLLRRLWASLMARPAAPVCAETAYAEWAAAYDEFRITPHDPVLAAKEDALYKRWSLMTADRRRA